MKQLLADLCETVRSMKKENRELTTLLGEKDGDARLEQQRAEAWRNRQQVPEKDAENAELKLMLKKVEQDRIVLLFVLLVSVSVVFGLLFSK